MKLFEKVKYFTL